MRAIYPGTFDPITNGHTDIIRRATKLFGGVIVAVAENRRKRPLFDFATRVRLAEEVLREIPQCTVMGFDTLLMDFVHQQGADIIVRGLRAVSDFEYEFQMAAMNRQLDRQVETVFLTPCEEASYLSASLVKEIAELGGNVDSFVHPIVKDALQSVVRGKIN